jgi:hypothetical protein
MLYLEIQQFPYSVPPGPIPVEDDNGKLIGGAVLQPLGRLSCFIERNGYTDMLRYRGMFCVVAMSQGTRSVSRLRLLEGGHGKVLLPKDEVVVEQLRVASEAMREMDGEFDEPV